MTIKTNAEYQKLLQNTKFVDYEVTLADGTKQLRIISEGTPAQIALHLRNTTPSMVSFKEVAVLKNFAVNVPAASAVDKAIV